MYGHNLNAVMDKLRRQSYPDSLKTTLNCYQLSSADSLSGPSGYSALAAQLWFKENNQSPPIPPPPLIQIPLLMPNDTSTNRSETQLAGERISCFIVGGEKRLCLPQILTTVLQEYSISDINRTCAELHIYCSRCSPDQLEILKVLSILPFNTTQCGLITKTDAERLVAALGVEFHLNSKHDLNKKDIKGLQVYHECFGQSDGIFYSDLYATPDSPCITCLDCEISFSPSRFVAHSHKGLEKRTCHWGFDPDNWRAYLLLPKNLEKNKQKDYEKILNQLKAKFDLSNLQTRFSATPPNLKRRHEFDYGGHQEKRFKEEKAEDSVFISPPRQTPLCFGYPYGLRGGSAFKPWSSGLPTLSQLPDLHAAQEEAILKAFGPIMHDRRLMPGYLQYGPPAVIPNSEPSEWPIPSTSSLRRGANGAPNITLAPAEQQKRTASYVVKETKRKISSPPARKTPPHPKTSGREDERRRPSDETNSVAPTRGPENPPQSEEKQPRTHDIPTTGQNSHYRQTKPTNENRSRLDEHENEIVDVTSYDSRPANHKQAPTSSTAMPPLLAMRQTVEAATAMLELSSAATDLRKLSRESESFSPQKSRVSRKTSDEGEDFKSGVMPLASSREHFKWTIGDGTFVISAAGTQELKTIRSLLDTACEKNHQAKQEILLELLKAKARHEEKLEVQERVKRDLEAELEFLKKEKRTELQKIRNEHSTLIKEANENLFELRKRFETSGNNSDNTGFLEVYEKRLKEQEKENSRLQLELSSEREKRRDRNQELEAPGRMRMPFLADGPLATMIRGSRKEDNSGKSRYSLSASGRRSLETIASSACYPPVTSADDSSDVIEVPTSRYHQPKLCRDDQRTHSSKDPGFRDVSPL